MILALALTVLLAGTRHPAEMSPLEAEHLLAQKLVNDYPSLSWFSFAVMEPGDLIWPQRDTLTLVMKGGASHRAQIQFALGPPPPEGRWMPLKLQGKIPGGMLYRLPWKGKSAAVLWGGFPGEIRFKDVAEVRLGSGSNAPAAPGKSGGTP